ncbi:MAG: 50S ribosomal protein L10 [Verrucomicrobiota bacterium]
MRPEKQTIVETYLEKIGQGPFVLLTDFTGMKVDHFNELRNRLYEVNAEYRVVKNNLMRRALGEAELPDIADHLTGQTAVVLGEADVAAAAKVLRSFTKEFERPAVKAGILENAVLDSSGVFALADLPSREVLQAKLLGLLQQPGARLVNLLATPPRNLVGVLSGPSRKVLYALKAKIDQEGGA